MLSHILSASSALYSAASRLIWFCSICLFFSFCQFGSITKIGHEKETFWQQPQKSLHWQMIIFFPCNLNNSTTTANSTVGITQMEVEGSGSWTLQRASVETTVTEQQWVGMGGRASAIQLNKRKEIWSDTMSCTGMLLCMQTQCLGQLAARLSLFKRSYKWELKPKRESLVFTRFLGM